MPHDAKLQDTQMASKSGALCSDDIGTVGQKLHTNLREKTLGSSTFSLHNLKHIKLFFYISLYIVFFLGFFYKVHKVTFILKHTVQQSHVILTRWIKHTQKEMRHHQWTRETYIMLSTAELLTGWCCLAMSFDRSRF